eukprot:Skav208490  [mRNA]  locus=scaffold87:155106:165405:- [translate_table: standard]
MVSGCWWRLASSRSEVEDRLFDEGLGLEAPGSTWEHLGAPGSQADLHWLGTEVKRVSMDMEDEQEDEPAYEDPGQQVACAGQSFVLALADVLTHLSSLRPASAGQRVTKFHSVRPPQLPIRDYLFRIARYFQCSRECFVLCLVYIDRIVKLHPDFTICSLNIHRLLVTSVMLAVKFFDDVYYSNAYYAKVGGVRTREVNALESHFLQLIEWKLHVTPEEPRVTWRFLQLLRRLRDQRFGDKSCLNMFKSTSN